MVQIQLLWYSLLVKTAVQMGNPAKPTTSTKASLRSLISTQTVILMSSWPTPKTNSFSPRSSQPASVPPVKSQSGSETMVTGTNLVCHPATKTLSRFSAIWLPLGIWKITLLWNRLRRLRANLASPAATNRACPRRKHCDTRWISRSFTRRNLMANIAQVIKAQMADRSETFQNLLQALRPLARAASLFHPCRRPSSAKWC